jgi:hypothetical protein
MGLPHSAIQRCRTEPLRRNPLAFGPGQFLLLLLLLGLPLLLAFGGLLSVEFRRGLLGSDRGEDRARQLTLASSLLFSGLRGGCFPRGDYAPIRSIVQARRIAVLYSISSNVFIW